MDFGKGSGPPYFRATGVVLAIDIGRRLCYAPGMEQFDITPEQVDELVRWAIERLREERYDVGLAPIHYSSDTAAAWTAGRASLVEDMAEILA